MPARAAAFGAVLCVLIIVGEVRPGFSQTQQAETVPSVEPPVIVAQVGQAPGSSPIIGDYWNAIYGPGGLQPPSAVEPPLRPLGSSVGEPSGFQSLLDHLIFRLGATYTHNFVEFSGRPTSTFVVNGGQPFTVTPQGFAFPQVFKSNDDRIDSYLVLGTRGYGDPRLNTYFSMIYRQDFGAVAGSPFQNILDVFQDHRQVQVLNAYAEWNGLGTGLLSHASIRVGRQYVFDYVPDLLGSPIVDGATVSYRDPKLDLTVFAGRRVNLYTDQENDFTMGGSVSYNLLPRTSLGVNYFFLPGENRYAFNLNHQIGDIRTGSFLTFRNEHPIELGTRVWYSSPSSPWTLRGVLRRQLTDDDYVYDIFAAREFSSNDPQDRVRRLLMGQIRPATYLTLDADRQITPWLTLGAGFAGRWVDAGEAPFDNSFEQVSVRATLMPWTRWDFSLQYRFRHVDRSPVSEAAKAVFFDDISHAGETTYHELNTEVYYRLASRFNVRLGGYAGLYNSRDRLTQVNGIILAGGYVRTQFQIHRMMDLRFEYAIDRGNPEFNPDIKRQHSMRMGFDFHF